MKTIQLYDSEELYLRDVFWVYKFRNHNRETLHLTWPEAMDLVINAGYKYIPFYS